jgi:hypothetical protein
MISSPERKRDVMRRFALAFALSLALHEIAAGLWPRRPPPPPEERVVAQLVTVAVRTPAPTPRPTPRITPAPHYSIAPRIVVRAPAALAAATPAHTLGGAAARKRIVVARPVPRRPAPPKSVAEGTQSGQANGGAGTGAGPGAGTGGLGGTGSGTAAQGNGNGGDTNAAPCGDIFLLPGDVAYRRDGAVLQEVVAKIILRDGTVEVGKFPYPFVYSAEAQNPFRHDVGLAKNGGIAVQMPPAGTDLSALPASVDVVLKHTDPVTGTTDLPECSPAPAAT